MELRICQDPAMGSMLHGKVQQACSGTCPQHGAPLSMLEATSTWHSLAHQQPHAPPPPLIQYPLLLGRGACKRVFRAIDCELGIEVAWNQVELVGMLMDDQDDKDGKGSPIDRLLAEINVLKQLHHKNIMAFHDWW
jgi:hypothetical protein